MIPFGLGVFGRNMTNADRDGIQSPDGVSTNVVWCYVCMYVSCGECIVVDCLIGLTGWRWRRRWCAFGRSWLNQLLQYTSNQRSTDQMQATSEKKENGISNTHNIDSQIITNVRSDLYVHWFGC